MANVFISHSRLDRERVKPLAERLASLGYSVRWTQSEHAGQASVDGREEALDAARAVLAVWSENGRNAAEVHADAAHAFGAGKLLQLKLDFVAPPPPFDRMPMADMTGAGAWGPLEHALSRLVKNGESQAPLPADFGPAPTIAATGAPRLVTVAIATALAAFAGALGAAFNGVMTPDQLQVALVGMLGVAGACAGLSAHRLYSITRAAA